MIVKPETLIGWHRKGFKLSGFRNFARNAGSGLTVSAGSCVNGASSDVIVSSAVPGRRYHLRNDFQHLAEIRECTVVNAAFRDRI